MLVSNGRGPCKVDLDVPATDRRRESCDVLELGPKEDFIDPRA